MTPSLAPLTSDPSWPLRKALAAAVQHDHPDTGALAEAGIPRWDADALMARLNAAQELVDGRWAPGLQAAYRRLLIAEPKQPAPKRPAGPFADGAGPREKARALGIDRLDDGELLALLLRTGTSDMDVLTLARHILASHDGLVGLAGMEVERLMRSQGMGPAKAAEVAAAFELARRLSRAARRERPKLAKPDDVAALLAADLAALDHERFFCLPLDPRSRLLGEPREVSRGDIDGTEAGPRLFYRHALLAGAASVIAVHNHPTGDPGPSAADLAVTRRLATAGRTLDCPLMDHLVIGDGGRFTSIRRDHPECFALG